MASLDYIKVPEPLSQHPVTRGHFNISGVVLSSSASSALGGGGGRRRRRRKEEEGGGSMSQVTTAWKAA